MLTVFRRGFYVLVMRFVRRGYIDQIGRLIKFFQVIKRIEIPFRRESLRTFKAGILYVPDIHAADKFCFGNKPRRNSPVTDYSDTVDAIFFFTQSRA